MGLRRAITVVASAGVLFGLTLGAAVPALAAGKGTVVEYAGPEAAPLGEPSGITVAPDGSLWFAQTHNNKIGRITTDGVITQFSLPATSCTPNVETGLTCEPTGIAADKNGDLWFTEADADRIGRFHPATSAFTEFPLPQGWISPNGIAVGSDSRIWFTMEQFDLTGGAIGVIDPADPGTATAPKITTYHTLAGGDARIKGEPSSITAGESGVLWFAGGESIGKITTAGVITEYDSIQDGTTKPGGEFKGITAGPNGSVWFTESDDSDGPNRVWERNKDGAFKATLVGDSNNEELAGITRGPDGNVWFAENDADKVGSINVTTGAITEYGTANGISAKSDATGIVTGPDGNIWFTESSDVGKIGRLFVAPPVITGISAACEAGGTVVTISGTGLGGVTAVKFGDKSATNVSVNPSGTRITATIPAGTGTVKVTVTTPFGTSAEFSFTYLGKPAITAISPAAGPVTGATAVTITGSNFTTGSSVKFGDTAALNVTVTSDGKTIHATSPARSAVGDVSVVVTAQCGTSNAAVFTYGPILAQTGGGMGWPIAWLVLIAGASLAAVGVTFWLLEGRRLAARSRSRA